MYLPSPPPLRLSDASVRQRRQARSTAQSASRQARHRRTAYFESAARLLVNGVLLATATVSLGQLVPRIQQQRSELRQVEAAVAIAEQDQARLKADFGRYFDPSQTRAIMQEQSGWESSSQRQIVWISPESSQP